MSRPRRWVKRIVSWMFGLFGYRRYRLRDTRRADCFLCCSASRTVMRKMPPCPECGGTIVVLGEVTE